MYWFDSLPTFRGLIMSSDLSSLSAEAHRNLNLLLENSYPGRGLVLGVSPDGRQVVQLYWIMGRSENSQNRVFDSQGDRIFTEPANPARVKDPSLIIYNAMRSRAGRLFVVSNGSQTDDVTQEMEDNLLKALRNYQYEPDEPNFTPRITGTFILDSTKYRADIAILRRSPFGVACERALYQYQEIEPGYGYCVTTYQGDGNPLPSFIGEPLLVPIFENVAETTTTYWNHLNPDNRVSLVGKWINRRGGDFDVQIINRFAKKT